METKKKEDKEKQLANVGAATLSAKVACDTSARTDSFNRECTDYRELLAAKAEKNLAMLNDKLAEDPAFCRYRQKGVDVAWEYEKADVTMGGKGSADWNAEQREEIVVHGKARGYDGHHINSVASNPSLQTNPDNVALCNKAEHKEKHNGCWRNPSSGPLVNKDEMLRQTNTRRVLINEGQGLAKAASIGAGAGLVKSVYTTCKQEGWSCKSVKKGLKKSGKSVAEGTGWATLAYVTTRVVNIFIK